MKFISSVIVGVLFSICGVSAVFACNGSGEERWFRQDTCDVACEEARFAASLGDCAKTPAYCAWQIFEHRLEASVTTGKPVMCDPEGACGKKRVRLLATAATENSPGYQSYAHWRAMREFQSGGCRR